MKFLFLLVFSISMQAAVTQAAVTQAAVTQAAIPADSSLGLSKKRFLRDRTIIPLPVVFRFPETRFGAGAVVSATFSFAKDSAWAKPSQFSFGITYTQNKQVLIFMPFSIFAANNKYYLNSDTGLFKYNYLYFGIGENRVAEERFDVTFPRVRLLAAKLVAKNTYAGLRFQYEAYNVTGTALDGELGTGRVAGSTFSRTVSLGVSVLKDSRDAVFFPRHGVFGEFYVLPTLRAFGADRNFVRLFADLAHYQSFGSKHFVLATNYTTSFIVGSNIPFSQLSFLGGPRKMRGIYEGFFRDKNTALFQAEARLDVWKSLGVVGFGAMGFMGDDKTLIRLNLPKFTYGAGLRVTVQKKNHLNLRLDYGLSPYGKGNFYATLGEAF